MLTVNQVQDALDAIKRMRLVTWNVDFVNSGGDSSAPFDPTLEDRTLAPFEEANAYSSAGRHEAVGERTWHRVLLDIDFDGVLLYPSATPGHFHLVLNRTVSWEDYCALLTLLVRMNIVEPGYAELTKARGQAFLRLPGQPKTGGRIVDLSNDIPLDVPINDGVDDDDQMPLW